VRIVMVNQNKPNAWAFESFSEEYKWETESCYEDFKDAQRELEFSQEFSEFPFRYRIKRVYFDWNKCENIEPAKYGRCYVPE
tara:strand:- start:1499 stop:1744 length:246 start_codon:yes stop_codon:yes gene_type:complete